MLKRQAHLRMPVSACRDEPTATMPLMAGYKADLGDLRFWLFAVFGRGVIGLTWSELTALSAVVATLGCLWVA